MTTLCTTLPERINLLLIDDHKIFLDGLALALKPLTEDLRIDTAHSGAEAKKLIATGDYDLILLDLRLPDVSGLELLQQLQAQGNLTPVAILSASESTQDAQKALAAGALGFIQKSADGEGLRESVARVLLGEVLPSPFPDDNNPLTPRQREILPLLADGLPNKLISRRLGLSEDTIKTHLKALYQELNVHTRTACVSAARNRGWL